MILPTTTLLTCTIYFIVCKERGGYVYVLFTLHVEPRGRNVQARALQNVVLYSAQEEDSLD